jgi:hypothetical protein
MDCVTAVVVGYGDRGHAYTKYAEKNPERLKIVAVVEPNEFRRDMAKKAV